MIIKQKKIYQYFSVQSMMNQLFRQEKQGRSWGGGHALY